MLEQKLIPGRYIELTTLPPVNAGPAANGFQEVNWVVQHLDESESSGAPVTPNNPMPGFNPTFRQQIAIGAQRVGEKIGNQFDRQRVSTTSVGASAKVHRNFVWLEWLGGLVSEVRLNGVDVLTGPMSGCWITTYLRGGLPYVGHVGTVNLHADPLSVAARTAWNNFSAVAMIGAYSGFNPFNDPGVGAVQPGPLAGEGAMKTFALVTAAGTFHTLIGYSVMNKPSRIRIAGLKNNVATMPVNGQI